MTALKAVLPWGVFVVLAAAGCDGNPAANTDLSLLLEPEQIQLYVNESVPARAQLLNGGRNAPGDGIVFWSQNTSVAVVSTGGVVTAVLPGNTQVFARYGSLLDSIAVTVLADARGELRVLDIGPGEVSAATESGQITVPYLAQDGYGRPQCTPTGFSLRYDPFILAATTSTVGATCQIVLTPGAEGETWLVASVKGLSDSVRVKVQNGAYRAQFTESTVLSVTAGVPTPISVRMRDPRDQPVAGRTVWFTASPGLLGVTTPATDASGTATVTWTPPTVLAVSGGSGQVAFRTLFPTGAVASETRTVPIVGGAPVRVDWFSGVDGRAPLGASPMMAPLKNYITVSAAGRDAYGNQTPATPTLTFKTLSGPEPGNHDDRGNTCGLNLDDPKGLARYTACFATYRFQAAAEAHIRVYASFAGGLTDSLDVNFR